MPSDTENDELAIDATLDDVDMDVSAAPTSAPAQVDVDGFAVPAQPAMVDDVALIQAMVGAGEVVGSLPPITMSASEKRKLVEAQMAEAAAAAGNGPAPASTSAPASAPAPADPDSESSSEFESSSEEESDSDAERPAKARKPLTAAEHAALRAQLDKMVAADSSSEEESDDDDGVGGLLDNLGLDFMEDSEDEGGATGTAVMSAHEKPLPPVAQPPIAVLPADIELIAAGDVFSWMKERAVEAWLAKQAAAEAEKGTEKETEKDAEAVKQEPEVTDEIKKEPDDKDATEAAAAPMETTETKPDVKPDIDMKTDAESAAAATPSSPSRPKTTTPKFSSAGAVVIQAVQAPGQGWLEEGSVICLSDRRVLGTVAETFGPLVAPFYMVRLPPPPYPYPSDADLARGVRVFFPAAASYRRFVNMAAIRDPRFASDASNVFDEEIGDDEVEWSDDEAEAAAKRARKARRRGSRAPSATPGPGPHPSLPSRPHYDYNAQAEDEWENASDAGSVSGGGRTLVSYDDVAPNASRGQRQQRGRGRGRGRGQAPQGQGRPTGGGRQHPLPQRPVSGNWQQTQGQGQQGFQYAAYEPAGYEPGQPGMGMPPMGMMGMGMGMGMPMGMPMGMGMMPGMPMGMGQMGQMGQGDQMGPGQGQGQGQQQGNTPAINPRFAQMMGMGNMNMSNMGNMGNMGGGYWPQGGSGQSE
jgi:H/ACA ribonucleoprotein complex non-core subunit NAF1